MRLTAALRKAYYPTVQKLTNAKRRSHKLCSNRWASLYSYNEPTQWVDRQGKYKVRVSKVSAECVCRSVAFWTKMPPPEGAVSECLLFAWPGIFACLSAVKVIDLILYHFLVVQFALCNPRSKSVSLIRASGRPALNTRSGVFMCKRLFIAGVV